MAYLSREQRKHLEHVVGEARRAAEHGARAELRRLSVPEAEPASYLSAADRELRIRLRARAKQLGDVTDVTLEHGFERMVHACAYEQWHRMLFARFLSERNLLLHPDGVAVSLADCAELAADEGAADAWELAGRYAAAMLPQIFRPDDPLLAVRLADESRQKLEQMLARLDTAVFHAKDALGWVYQFWQAQKKEAINRSEVKIGADELPAVTQLFTEPYMVGFLLHNSLGAWWAGKVLAANPELATEAPDEAALRAACALPGVEWTYLRFVQEDGKWRPAAGTFDGWPTKAAKLKVLDPCCGSGHFLVGMLEILTALRAAEEGLGEAEACDAVLRDNLHGLEIDPRCTELAAFAVALAAWSLPGAAGVRRLPELKIACSGLSLGVTKKEWLALAADRPELLAELEQLYLDFENATVLGSLIQPRRAMGSLFAANAQQLEGWLAGLAGPKTEPIDVSTRELAVAAQGALSAAGLLAAQYTLVATNVPYLGIRRQSETLRSYCEAHFSAGKHDLAAAFLLRAHGFANRGGSVAVVTPSSWLQSGSYKSLRQLVLSEKSFTLLSWLGPGAFDSISGEVVNVVLSTTSNSVRRANALAGVVAEAGATAAEKAVALQSGPISLLDQASQAGNPDARILSETGGGEQLLSNYAESLAGIQNGDAPRFQRGMWEMTGTSEYWVAQQVCVNESMAYGGCDTFIYYDQKEGHLRETKAIRRERLHDSDQRGKSAWGKPGVLASRMGALPCTLYSGVPFDQNAAIILPRSKSTLPAIFSFCTSSEYSNAVRKIDSKLNVTSATLTKVPFDLAHWTAVAAEKYPNGLPKPFSSDPTQWLFNGHPVGSDDPLQVAVARLCGYRWPRQTGSSFPDCPALDTDGLEPLADDDGIVCLPAVLGERPAADRLLALLVEAYGDQWTAGTLQKLLSEAGHAGRDLEAWLRDAFFEQHCKRFQHRPFIWHIWDGERDGFSALLHYHRLDHATLNKLTYSYLGDWIQRQEQQARDKADGAAGRLAAAKRLQGELEKVLEGEPPYDIFVRWKPLAEQPVGWQPDLDDGVRLNIRPFLKANDVGRRDAGILRWRPNIHWNRDRGTDVQSAPWYKVFGGVRRNDHHVTLAEKAAVRGRG